MCLDERYTDNRGRPAALLRSSPRTRRLRRSNWFSFCSIGPASLLFAFIADDVLALIANALALVGLRRAGRPQLGRELADLLLVDARSRDQFLLGAAHLHVDAGR